ncbi:MAG: translation initiation factor [Verrucomicrobiota bacterium]
MPTKKNNSDSDKPAPVKKTLLKPITGRKAAPAETPAKPAKEEEEKPAKKKIEKPKGEVVSLIDDEGKTKPQPKLARKPITAGSRAIMPTISRIVAPEPVAPPPEAVASVAAAAAAATPPPVEITDSGEKILSVKPPISVKDLATAMSLKPFQVIKDLMGMGIFANQTQNVDIDVIQKVCDLHGWKYEREKREKGAGVHKEEKKIEPPPAPKAKEIEKAKPDELMPRPPVVVFMGHVDHGKTTLMDAVRKTRVAQGEAGGITQHIGAYCVKRMMPDGKEHTITFLDTPGHAAFTQMRARGASVTDIVVLVVDATDGPMPQTIEALNHAKAAKVKIIVAITKIDMNSANVEKVKGQLQEKGVVAEDWGGDTIVCPVSAIKGTGMDKLLESIVLEAEMLELKASHRVPARATVVEAQIEQGRGPTATVIVRMGTLKVGDPFICGDFSGKVKALVDEFGKNMKEAGPATPAKVIGFSGMPNAGDELIVMKNEREAQQLGAERQEKKRLGKLTQPKRATLENLFDTIAEGHKPVLNVVVKGDVQGSMEAIVNSLNQIESRKVDINFVHTAVGPISENDVLLAAASNAIIIGFNTKTENNAANAAKREGIQIKLFSIIYELIDQVKEAMAGLLSPESREQVIGHAQVKQVFDLTKGVVAGCYVNDGRILRTARARVLRNRQPIYDGGIATLRRFQDDVKEVRSGVECGIKLGDFDEYEPGDIIQCYILEKVAQTL